MSGWFWFGCLVAIVSGVTVVVAVLRIRDKTKGIIR